MSFNVCKIIHIFGIIGCVLLYQAEGHVDKRQHTYDHNNPKTSMDAVFQALQIHPNTPTWNQHTLVFSSSGEANELKEERQLYNIIYAKRLRRTIRSSGFWFTEDTGNRPVMKKPSNKSRFPEYPADRLSVPKGKKHTLKELSNKSWFSEDPANRLSVPKFEKQTLKKTKNKSWFPDDPANRLSVPKNKKTKFLGTH